MEGTEFAKNYIRLIKMREDTEKEIIHRNMCNIFGFNSEKKGGISNEKLYDVLAEILDVKSSTVFAWMNKSRGNAKITFDKMCILAELLDIPVSYLMTDSSKWYDSDSEMQIRINKKVSELIGGYCE